MYKFTALLNTSNQTAYLSGNNNCSPELSLEEMYEIATDTTKLSPSSPYAQWACSLTSVKDFKFYVFLGETKQEIENQALAYAQEAGCTTISKGRPTIARY
eukprot:TRINITY_DN1567_c0_g4_i3.p7 TRINITY_DN1567_c0_g4~~TRINITY_DN1567_c0_g4_i3.p7  ORF type:complete len:101 (+),score=5.92 TRINITY_DN1567_c0_g4_i3:995-1297(+)